MTDCILVVSAVGTVVVAKPDFVERVAVFARQLAPIVVVWRPSTIVLNCLICVVAMGRPFKETRSRASDRQTRPFGPQQVSSGWLTTCPVVARSLRETGRRGTGAPARDPELRQGKCGFG